MGICNYFVEECAHAVIALEVAFDVARRLLARNAEVARESVVTQPVDDAEVDGLCAAALLPRHLRERYAEHLRRRACVDVLSRAECVDHGLVARHMREDAQLDLRVVRREECVIARARRKERTYGAPFLRAHGDILKVRVGA